jgi:hypothetical protein
MTDQNLINGNITILWAKNNKLIDFYFKQKNMEKYIINGIFSTTQKGVFQYIKLDMKLIDSMYFHFQQTNEMINGIINNDCFISLIIKHFNINYEFNQNYKLLSGEKNDAIKNIEYSNFFMDRLNKSNNLTTKIEYKTLPEFNSVELLSSLQINCTIGDSKYLYRDEVWQTVSNHYNSVLSFKSTKRDISATFEQNYKM